jgi:undecaprenyl-diphosphatase
MTLVGGQHAPAASLVARLLGAPSFWIGLMRRKRSPAAGRRVRPPLVAIGGGLILAVIVFAAILTRLDAEAMIWRRGLSQSTVAVFEIVTALGLSGWILIPSAVLLFAIAGLNGPRLGRMSSHVLTALTIRLGFVFLAVGLPGLVVAVGKRLIGRVRPSELGPFAFEPLSWRAAYASLPSGHTTTAFAALIALGAVWPRARPALLVYAIAVGLSRVVVNAHYPSDVIAGALFGGFGAWLVREWYAARGLGFYMGTDGRVHARPGPSLARLKKVARAVAGQ